MWAYDLMIWRMLLIIARRRVARNNSNLNAIYLITSRALEMGLRHSTETRTVLIRDLPQVYFGFYDNGTLVYVTTAERKGSCLLSPGK